MNILATFKRFFIKPKQAEASTRDYWGAMQSRLTNDWAGTAGNADAEIRSSLATLRNRCRDLERNNDYARRYFKLLENNVLGADGIRLQMKVREMRQDPKSKKWVEQYDTRANRIVEDKWWEWGQAGVCTLSRSLTWVDLQRMVLRSVARDGCILVRKHFGNNLPHKFALEPIEADQLDIDHNASLPGGRVIRLGIQYDATGAPEFYHILRNHPGELFQPRVGRSGAPWREAVPASQCYHVFMPERVGQSTGVPWLISAMTRLKHLAAYEEAEVVAARMGAAKMGFLVPNATGMPGYTGPEAPGGKKYGDVTPGSIEQLPYGMNFQAFDPTHPNSAFKDFIKASLRGISAGLGVSYTSLANDLEAVNYSSIRAGLLEEREEWKTIQGWFISHFVSPVFNDWFEQVMAFGLLTDGVITLPISKQEKFNAPEWKPRRWGWVDPLADLQAQVLAVDKGFKSRRQMIAENGGDIEETFSDISADESLAEQFGLDFDESEQQANAQKEKPKSPADPAKPLTTEKD